MVKPFTSAAKIAIEDMVVRHTQTSKFGYFLTEEGLASLVTDLVEFLETSRSLKAAGDRLLAKSTEMPSAPSIRAKEMPR